MQQNDQDSGFFSINFFLFRLLKKPISPEVPEVPDAGICECGAWLRTEFRQVRKRSHYTEFQNVRICSPPRPAPPRPSFFSERPISSPHRKPRILIRIFYPFNPYPQS